MNPNKWYRQTVEMSFHVSMATLDIAAANDEIVQVILCYNNKDYQLCNLHKDSVWQIPLDLNFQKGTKIAFACNGLSHVYLTGYLKSDKDFNLDEQEEDEKEDKDEDDDDNDGKKKEDIKKRSIKQSKKYKQKQKKKLDIQKLANGKYKKKN